MDLNVYTIRTFCHDNDAGFFDLPFYLRFMALSKVESFVYRMLHYLHEGADSTMHWPLYSHSRLKLRYSLNERSTKINYCINRG